MWSHVLNGSEKVRRRVWILPRSTGSRLGQMPDRRASCVSQLLHHCQSISKLQIELRQNWNQVFLTSSNKTICSKFNKHSGAVKAAVITLDLAAWRHSSPVWARQPSVPQVALRLSADHLQHTDFSKLWSFHAGGHLSNIFCLPGTLDAPCLLILLLLEVLFFAPKEALHSNFK